jgi:hypothetical protein
MRDKKYKVSRNVRQRGSVEEGEVHGYCYKTDGEIPVHTHDDAGRQRSTTGKYFPYESGVNTCFALAVF